MALLLNAFVNASKWISPENNIAHGLAREKLENLLEEVRQDRWDDAARRLHPDYDPPSEALTLNAVAYTRDYDVEAVTGRPYRKAKVTVQWPS